MRSPSWCAVFALLVTACGSPPPAPSPAAPTPEGIPTTAEILARHQVRWDEPRRAEAITAGRAVLVRHECNRCHTIDDVEPAARPDHCTSCHQFLKGLRPGERRYETLASRYGAEIVQRYQRNIDHFQEVPDLTKIAVRLRPSWIGGFLREPQDLRPAMHETMIRTNLSEEDAITLARYFAAVAGVADPSVVSPSEPPAAPPRPSEVRLREGARLFREKSCNTCHTLGNVDTGRTAQQLEDAGLPARLAPNLRFARERMDPDVIVAWILDPEVLHPGSRMPDLQLTPDEAAKVRDFIVFTDPQLGPARSLPDVRAPEPVSRPVSWAEVKAEVLGKICVHCHMNAHERDDGPGNGGGFGWPGNRLAMRTYEQLVWGAVAPDGTRYSVLEPRTEGGLPPLVDAMLRRRFEEQRDHVLAFDDHPRASMRTLTGTVPVPGGGSLGMPMGLPSMTDAQIALVRAWIAQGCPGPTEITGMPGIRDGFLVPDGPIAVNQGCGLREPSAERPAWSTHEPPEWERERGPSPAPAPAAH